MNGLWALASKTPLFLRCLFSPPGLATMSPSYLSRKPDNSSTQPRIQHLHPKFSDTEVC